jgi:hypothetical protein
LAAPLFCAIFIHNTLQNSQQKSLYFNRQNHQQIGIFSLSTERVKLKKRGGFFAALMTIRFLKFRKNLIHPGKQGPAEKNRRYQAKQRKEDQYNKVIFSTHRLPPEISDEVYYSNFYLFYSFKGCSNNLLVIEPLLIMHAWRKPH